MNLVGTRTQTGRSVLILGARLLLAALTALGVVLGAVAGFTLAIRLLYLGRPLPGVSVAGIGVSGRTPREIEAMVAQALSYPESGLIALRDGGRLWAVQPVELGLNIDLAETARTAVAVGRQGTIPDMLQDQTEAWSQGVAVAPVVVFDQGVGAARLRDIAREIDRPTLEAALSLEGLQVVVSMGQIGRRLDLPATLDRLAPPLTGMQDSLLDLAIVETPPEVLDASAQAALAQRILSQPLVLTAEGAAPWTLAPQDLAAMLRFTLVRDGNGTRFALEVDPEAFAAALEPLAPELERDPENARFYFDDETRELVLIREAVIGRSLDVPATIAAVNAGLNAGQHEIGLAFQTVDPQVRSDATAAELGITENVVAVSTYFAGSSTGRRQNIATASAAFHGLLIPPGGQVSAAEVLGEISLDTGYAEALIIFGDRTINGVGGGVCQVSTTLFRAVFFGGYQIDERHPHAYRVGYYEQGPGSPGPGLDATVFVPVVDFRFTNDTPYWLLMETYIYGNQLLWKFYSTSDGRTVDWSTSGPRNVEEAEEPLYRENPELSSGEIRQVDYEADGMDVTVNRSVTRGGEVIHQDTIRTHYLPWRAIYEYGPGTELPEGAETD